MSLTITPPLLHHRLNPSISPPHYSMTDWASPLYLLFPDLRPDFTITPPHSFTTARASPIHPPFQHQRFGLNITPLITPLHSAPHQYTPHSFSIGYTSLLHCYPFLHHRPGLTITPPHSPPKCRLFHYTSYYSTTGRASPIQPVSSSQAGLTITFSIPPTQVRPQHYISN